MKYAWWRRVLIVVPLAVGAGVFYMMASNKQVPNQVALQEQSMQVRVITTKGLDIVPKMLGYGNVSAARVWNMVAKVAGEIDYMHPEMKEGAILQAGTELIRISPKDYELQVKQARANIRQINANISELEVKRASIDQSAGIEMQALKLKEKQLARKQQLRQRGTVSDSIVDEEENVVLLQRQKIQDLRNEADLIPVQIEAQRAQIAVYQSQLETAELNLERVHIRLPFDARIADVSVEQTQYVQTGKEMGTADNTETVEVKAQIPLSQFRQFLGILNSDQPVGTVDGKSLQGVVERTGLHAIVRLPFNRSESAWLGRVMRVVDEIDPETRTVGVIVVVDRPYEKIIPGKRPLLSKGMFVEVEFRSNPRGKTIAVPRSALRNGQVYVAGSDNRLEIRPVVVAFRQGRIAAIADGLRENERVVVSDLIYATEGMLIDALEDGALAAVLRDEAAGRDLPR